MSYGRFLLTGSQSLPLMQGISESLAGRAAFLSLYPCTWQEMLSIPGRDHDEIYDASRMATQTIQGFYPEFLINTQLEPAQWHAAYLTSYLERDVRNMKHIGDLMRFQTFVELLAAWEGQCRCRRQDSVIGP